MTVRAALVFLLAVGLTGCVTSGDQNPEKPTRAVTRRATPISSLASAISSGEHRAGQVPLRKALEIDPSSADAHAALAVVFQTEMGKLADEGTARRSPAIAAMPGY